MAAPRTAAGALQDRLGNGGLSRLLRAHQAASIQAKLTVSRPNDHHELEADRAADAVMSGSPAPARLTAWSPGIQRACSTCAQAPNDDDMQLQRRAHGSADGPEEDEELLQRKAEGPDRSVSGGGIEAGVSAAQGGGQPLPSTARSFFERRFERDFTGVRVHADAAAADLNRRLQAHAFTRGNDIFFAAGRFDPSSEAGKQLLAHELAHTVQQAGAPDVNRR